MIRRSTQLAFGDRFKMTLYLARVVGKFEIHGADNVMLLAPYINVIGVPRRILLEKSTRWTWPPRPCDRPYRIPTCRRSCR